MIRWMVVAAVATSVIVGCAKPCSPIPESESVRRLGLVLDGGRLCKDEGSVATIDYPEMKAEAIAAKYKDKFSSWKANSPDDKTLLLTRGDKDTLFIITGLKSKERRVPFAIVRYCEDSYCRKSLMDLATAMEKYKH